MLRAVRTFLAAVCATAMGALPSLPASADVVHLKGGGRLVGDVLDDGGERIRVVMPGGAMTVLRSLVERVDHEESAAEAFARRRKALREGDVRGALELADFAGDAGLSDERGELLKAAAQWAPQDDAVRSLLERWRVFERRLAPNPAAEATLAASLGKDAKVYRTAHWRIAYDCDLAVVRRRGEMLEASWRKFHEFAARLGVAAKPIDDRLECLVFRDHAAWERATQMPAEDVRDMVGIYLWTNRRVLLFDTRTAPQARDTDRVIESEIAALSDARVALDSQRGEIERLDRAVKDGTAAQRKTEDEFEKLVSWIADARRKVEEDAVQVSSRETDLQRYRDEVRRRFDEANVAATTHEACHQLAFAFGVSRAGQPKWLVEGLGTLFEAQSRTNFVLEAPNAARLRDVKTAWKAGSGGDLRRVVGDVVFEPESDLPLAYAESWALTSFLANRRGEAFARYLREGAILAHDPSSEKPRLEDFRRFFGDDLDALSREWHAYVDRL